MIKKIGAKPKESDVNERLKRLESTVERLVETLDSTLAKVNRQEHAENRPPKAPTSDSYSLRIPNGISVESNANVRANAADTSDVQGMRMWNSSLKSDLETNMSLCATNHNRMIAAQKQVEAVQAAWNAGTVTLDLLLESQRREVDAKCAYARTIADLSNVTGDKTAVAANERRYQLIDLKSRKEGRDKAVQLWKDIHALAVAGKKGGEADKEAAAREQYFFFRSEVETAQANVYRADAKLKNHLAEVEAQSQPKDKPNPEIELPR